MIVHSPPSLLRRAPSSLSSFLLNAIVRSVLAPGVFSLLGVLAFVWPNGLDDEVQERLGRTKLQLLDPEFCARLDGIEYVFLEGITDGSEEGSAPPQQTVHVGHALVTPAI